MFYDITDEMRARGRRGFAALLFLIALPTAAVAQDGAGATNAATASTEQAPGTEAVGTGLLAEPQFISKALDLSKAVFGDDAAAPKSGFYPEFSNMITGSGFISAGPGYRYNFNGNQAFFDTSAALSWHLYKMAQARLEFSQLANDRLTIGTQTMWQDNTQVSYFGLGPDTVSAGESQYRMQTTDVVGYAALRPVEWASIGGEFGWLHRPRVMETAGTFNPGYPYAPALYANDPAMKEPFQPNFLRGEISATINTLDSRSHPTEGGLYRGAITVYSDQTTGIYSFNQYEGEVVRMVPLGDRRVTLGLHGWTVFSDVPGGHAIPFYLMPVLGGNNTLRGYDDYQFHDENTVVATAELRLALLAHLDAAGFFDAGNVAARYTDLNFDKTSYGAGLRLHMRQTTFARMDVAYGPEGWRFVFRTSDPFKLSRVTRVLASVPAMP